MKIIVFISELESDIQQQWLALIKQQLINETILLPHQISDTQAKSIDIAIVANPNPNDLARYTDLIWIQSLWAGVEKLTSGILNKSVKLVRLIDPQLAQTMAESVLAWTLYLQRNMAEYAQQQASKRWNQLPCISSNELRVSVLGAGTLGSAALNALNKLEYQLSCWSRTPKQYHDIKSYSDFNGLKIMLGKTDILINLLPLTQQTHHLLDKELLSELPKGSKLINFSRGAVIDTHALLELLEIGHLSHAVLDVFEQEPLASSDPVWSNPKITVLPHISAPTNMHTASEVVGNNIKMYRENNVIPKSVDIKQGY
ncbi:2-hydroxyacid dehydrogenase [Colwellia sp. 12G3]|uniref:2-hydroxyacid dehydrogenase n=1 Tax=Colwellia sp. 12G3 TaxID=2058299 RepID=UPI000C3258FA|nr:glyoxylate/hydroxypyruvate reductase A [Colwellia sp. 12G3]PKI13993.1 glyoxylate/hydroxypyruvate reductase A [Colwellia sp. 12G3]